MKLLHHIGEHADELAVVSLDGEHEIARFRYAELDRFVAAGQLSVAELFDTRPRGEADLCRRLALLACARACHHGMACLAFDCPHHPVHGGARTLDVSRSPERMTQIGATRRNNAPR